MFSSSEPQTVPSLTRSQVTTLGAIFFFALFMRLISLPTVPFFCDVPMNIKAVETGKMVIQFPGYAGFHWVIRILGMAAGGPWAGAVVFSMICGVAAMVYCTRFAFDRGGYPSALLTAAFIGFSPLSAYFSCVGASYTTDLVGMSAILFHGNRFLASRDDRHFRWVVLWFVFGCLMRTLSFWFLGLGVVYLLWKFPIRKNFIFTVVISVIGAALFWMPTIYYYNRIVGFDKIAGFKSSLGSPTGAGFHSFNLVWLLENEVRNALFLLWSVNIFALIIPGVIWLARKHLNRPLTTFLVCLTLPYFLFLIWYDCHAGYVMLLLPAFVCAPCLIERPAWPGNRALVLALVFAILSFIQFFFARPIPFRGLPSLIANTYLFTYTNQAIRVSMFGNLQQWALWTHTKVSTSP